MNTLRITINPYSGINSSSLDGRTLSPYSELSNYLKKPFVNWADKLWGAAEHEINDCYKLIISSEQFDSLLISDMVHEYELCKSYEFQPFIFNSTVDKRYSVILKLASKYHIEYNQDEFFISVCSSDIEYLKSPFITSTDASKALIIISSDESIVNNNSLQSPAFVIIPSDTNSVSCIGSSRFVWRMVKEQIPLVMNAVIDRFYKIPIIKCITEKINQLSVIDANDKQILELANSIEPLVNISIDERVELGSVHHLQINTIPENQMIPKIRIESTTSGILNISDTDIVGASVGETQISIFKSDEIIPFFTKKITVFQDRTAKKIILDRKEPTMGIGKSQRIGISFVPKDADDSAFVIWSVDDNDKCSVDDNGVVIAKKTGRVTVTASTQHIKESIIIDVLPNIEQMSISSSEVKLMKGDSFPISVTYAPQNCFNNSCQWTTDDSTVANVDVYPDGSSFIRTKEPGECIITCQADDGGCSVSCHVIVLDPDKEMEKEKQKKKLLDIACIIGIPLAIILIVWIVAAIFK